MPEINLDLFSIIIFLGIMQGLFISYFFMNKNARKVKANLYFGFLIITMCLLGFDIWSCYTNYMFKWIYLEDSTEFLNLLIGPLFFFYIISKLNVKISKIQRLHYLPAFIYFVASIFNFNWSYEARYNSYISDYHPTLKMFEGVEQYNVGSVYISEYVNFLVILSISFYLFLSIYYTLEFFRREIPSSNKKEILKQVISEIITFAIVLISLVSLKIYFGPDYGDFLIITIITLIIYLVSFRIIKESLFFKNQKYDKKYEKSSVDNSLANTILVKIEMEMRDNRYFLNPNASMPDLAKLIKQTPNNLSQVINNDLGKSFFDLLADYRVEEAKRILNSDSNLTIEQIAYSVGYNSKSTFNKVFKKITSITPSEFRDSKG